MILGFCGFSDSGKTTMIVKLVERLKDRYSIAVVKHVSHEIDMRGKDSERFRAVGAKEVVLIGGEEVRIKDPENLFSALKSLDYDVIFVEGFKKEKFVRKVCLGEADCEGCVMRNPDLDEVLKFVEEEIEVERILAKLPNFNCGECGHRNCEEMARAIHRGEDKFENCRYWNPNALVSVKVNGKEIYMGRFAQDVVMNTIAGLLSSFKGVGKIEDMEIKIKKSA